MQVIGSVKDEFGIKAMQGCLIGTTQTLKYLTIPGKAGVAMLYLFVGKEAKKNNGLAPDVDVDDINKIDFEAKGLNFHIEMLCNRQRKFNLVLTPHFYKPRTP